MALLNVPKQLFALGLEALDAGEFAKAETYFAETLGHLPRSIPALSNLMFCKFHLHKLKEMADVANRIIAIYKDHIDAYLALAVCHKEFSQHNLALIACDQILSRDAHNSDALNIKGAVLNNLGRHEEAITILTDALAINPRMADCLVNIGNARRALKDFRSSILNYDEALSVRPDLAIAWLGRGNVLADIKSHDEAFAAYDKALSITPDLENAWVGRGNVLADLRRHDEAIAAYDKALSIKPELERNPIRLEHNRIS